MAILATGSQPVLLFETAPAVLGVAVAALAVSSNRRDRRVTAALRWPASRRRPGW